MIKVSVKNLQGELKNGGTFATMQAAEEWVSAEENKEAFGKPAWVEQIPAVVDEQGNVLELAQEIQHQAEYTVEYQDITADLEAAEQIELEIQNQAIGAKIIAKIKVINQRKIDSGQWTIQDVQAVMTDSQLSLMREMLWAGAIPAAKGMIQGVSTSHYTEQEITELLAFITSLGF